MEIVGRGIFTHWTLFPSPKQQLQSTEVFQ